MGWNTLCGNPRQLSALGTVQGYDEHRSSECHEVVGLQSVAWARRKQESEFGLDVGIFRRLINEQQRGYSGPQSIDAATFDQCKVKPFESSERDGRLTSHDLKSERP